MKEKLWAKLPSYYIEDKFIRLIPFKDHINIEAKSILQYKKELKEFKITLKGMLQIYISIRRYQNLFCKKYLKHLYWNKNFNDRYMAKIKMNMQKLLTISIKLIV